MRRTMIFVLAGPLHGSPRLGSHDGLMQPLLQLDGHLHGNTASAEVVPGRTG